MKLMIQESMCIFNDKKLYLTKHKEAQGFTKDRDKFQNEILIFINIVNIYQCGRYFRDNLSF